uniref:Uncharacterized protein n=1 Tax=Trypanosoma vivax (strain Y486) TaxID=1055687 RepID=G0TST4_TRYVY|nr:hypothetical protein TVY486_0301990 [Trypanosoma vivax Y486]
MQQSAWLTVLGVPGKIRANTSLILNPCADAVKQPHATEVRRIWGTVAKKDMQAGVKRMALSRACLSTVKQMVGWNEACRAGIFSPLFISIALLLPLCVHLCCHLVFSSSLTDLHHGS